MTLRLRQICLVAPELEPVVDAVGAIFGLPVCHRDPAVASYGLVNALFVCGHQFLEVVAPTREGTAAGRFLQRSGGRGGYMAIFDTDDPERRRAHAQALGVRIAHTMDYPGFVGSQLHPVDCRATMLEFDRSTGNEDLERRLLARRSALARRPTPRRGQRPAVDRPAKPRRRRAGGALGAHHRRAADARRVTASRRCVSTSAPRASCRRPPAAPERLDALHIEVADAARTCAAARACGYALEDDGDGAGFVLAGVRCVPHTRAAVAQP